ncbi:MAG: Rrf2 family transcriptional regulator [Thermodesulfovibrionales bacterium]
MFVTRLSDYAIRCVLYLSRNGGRLASVGEIAESMYVPKNFLAKILQKLVKAGIVKSTRGAKGGFQLARQASEISLLDVLEAVQGPTAVNVCAIDSRQCGLSSTCAVHPVWVSIREMIERELAAQTFARLAGGG